MKYFGVLSLIFSLLACIPMPPQGQYNQYSTGYPDQTPGIENKQSSLPPQIERTEKRDEVLEKSKERHDGEECEYESDRHQCRVLCKEMYGSRDKDECIEELTASQIEDLKYEVYDKLENPRSTGLERINLEDLEVFLETSPIGFYFLTGEYDERDAEEILYWLMTDEEVTKIFSSAENRDFTIIEDLLGRLYGSFRRSNLHDPLNAEIEGKTVFETAVGRGMHINDEAIEWLLEYVFTNSDVCNDDEKFSKNCWGVICKIGEGFQDGETVRARKLFLDHNRDFKRYVSKIIERDTNRFVAGTNNAGWCAPSDSSNERCQGPSISDVDDVGDWLDLCGGLCDSRDGQCDDDDN